MAPSPQQDAVRAAVRELDHPTADEVFMRVRETLPRVSLATIYRNLDHLAERGEIRARRIGATNRYDPRLDRHAHLHCQGCDRLIDVPYDEKQMGPLLKAAKDASFEVFDQTLELVGLCSTCQKQPDRTNG